MKEMRPRIPIEIVVGVLGGLSCIVTISGLGLPVWALFIGWAWYFALGAQPSAFKKIVPAVFPGALLAALCLWLMEAFYRIRIHRAAQYDSLRGYYRFSSHVCAADTFMQCEPAGF